MKNVVHLGACIVGLSYGIRICQGKEIEIRLKSNTAIPIQIDGEPCFFDHSFREDNPLEMKLRLNSQVLMLKRNDETSASEIEKKCLEVLEWAEENKHISPKQNQILTKELANRIHS